MEKRGNKFVKLHQSFLGKRFKSPSSRLTQLCTDYLWDNYMCIYVTRKYYICHQYQAFSTL